MAINAASQQFAKATFKALAHGAFQGGMTAINGGNFWNGFAAGALSSIAASAWSGGTTTTEGFDQQNNWAYGTKTITHAGLGSGSGTIGAIAFGTVAGGASAALTGGNFWQGAVTGLFVSTLNHTFHDDGPGPKSKPKPKPIKAPSLDEANKFYQRANGKTSDTFQLPASSIDLDFVDTTGWVEGGTYNVQTLFKSENGAVFGRLNLTYKGNNQVQIQSDYYDFNLEFSNPLKVSEFFSPRNFFTGVGQLYAGSGVPFTFTFQGLNTITPRVYNFERGPKY